MTEYREIYPKLLLLGEYSILLGGNALTFPLRDFSARFDFLDNAPDVEIAVESNKTLRKLVAYFDTRSLVKDNIDLTGFKTDVDDGLYFLSNIPSGYGLGSSGAICAAIVKTYAGKKIPDCFRETGLLKLKPLFASMEAFFHGTSSGLDPIACYLERPLLIKNNELVELPGVKFNKGHWFLLDSGISRNTGTLVDCFIQNCNDKEYKNSFESNYIPKVNELANEITENLKRIQQGKPEHVETINHIMEGLSSLQFQYFEEMIPPTIRPVWAEGLNTGSFYLKLLGAGGGGFFLGFTKHRDNTEMISAKHGYRLVWPDNL